MIVKNVCNTTNCGKQIAVSVQGGSKVIKNNATLP